MACAGVGYLTSRNPGAQAADGGVLVRVLIIGTLSLTAMYAQSVSFQKGMGFLLAAACVFCSLWLLNGSSNRLAFSVGALLSGPAVVVACYVMLAQPRGTLSHRKEIRFVTLVGGAAMALWIIATLTTTQPPLRTPLLACMPHCPRNAFFLGFTLDGLLPALRIALQILWAALTLGTIVLLARRWRSASVPVRHSLVLPWIVSCLAAVLLVGYFVVQRSGSDQVASGFATGYIVVWAVIPVAVLAGLAAERLFMGQALARFVSRLAEDGDADPGALMAATLQDPSLSIAYARPGSPEYVTFSGAEITALDSTPGRDVTWIERDHRPLAAVTYNSDLADQRPFMRAAGDAAVMRLERAQLLADLRASTADLAASRLRLVETAQAERRRIERDLHDSVQQDLLGLRLRLDLAGDLFNDDPDHGRRMIGAVGRQLDEVLESLRALSRGIYPSLLRHVGLVEAVRSAARRSPVPVSVRGVGVDRYTEDTEIAVYFCCLEGFQNIAKHAGPNAHATIRFWHGGAGALKFEIRDSGAGFDLDEVDSERGLANMRDRIEAVGGTLTIISRLGAGTVIRGVVPVQAKIRPDALPSPGMPRRSFSRPLT